jgi:alpha-aminoadipic semialdehyde synthase
MAHDYDGLDEAKEEIRAIGHAIETEGLPGILRPMVVGFTGYGNVSRGAQEIFDLLPHVEITPQELLAGKAEEMPVNRLVKVVFREADTVQPISAGKRFALEEYFAHPERYKSIFRPYADHLTMLINCIYWSPKNPMLLTKAHAKELWGPGKTPRLRVIGDISCDIEGGIEFTMKATKPDNPVFTYYPQTDTIVDGVEPSGPTIMSIDNLPCELSAEASRDFSKALQPLLPGLLSLSLEDSFERVRLPAELRRATLLWQGKFTPEYDFMREFVK